MGEVLYTSQSSARPARVERVSTVARVLVVDADPATLAAITQALQSEGHATATAFDAAGAVAISQRVGPFDLLIVDLASTDGAELASTLRRQNGNLQVVYLASGSGCPRQAVDEEVIEKPFGESELLDAVSSALYWHAPRSTR